MSHAGECVRLAGLTDDLTSGISFSIWLETGFSLRSKGTAAAMMRA
jgi:hypothetical protein